MLGFFQSTRKLRTSRRFLSVLIWLRPWYFSSELALDVLRIQFREVELAHDDPEKYGSDAHLIYFTPRVDSIDPCVKFKEQLENMGHPDQ